MSDDKNVVRTPFDDCTIRDDAKKFSQRGSYTRGDKILGGIGLLVLAALFGGFSLFIYLSDFIAVIQIFLIPATPICAIWGYLQILTGLSTSQHTCKCSVCSTDSPTLEDVTVRPCPNCFSLIRIVGDMKSGSAFVAVCPACNSPATCFGTSGEFRCINCGTWITVQDSGKHTACRDDASAQCPECGATLTDKTYACPQCRALLKPDEVQELKEVDFLSLSPFGHLIYAKSQITVLDNILQEKRISQASVEKGLKTSGRALLSMEVTSRKDGSLAQDTLACLVSLQVRYAGLLAQLHQALTKAKKPVLKESIPAALQHQVVEALRQTGCEMEGILEWRENIVTGDELIENDTVGSFMEQAIMLKVKDFSGVLAEAKRLHEIANKGVDSDEE